MTSYPPYIQYQTFLLQIFIPSNGGQLQVKKYDRDAQVDTCSLPSTSFNFLRLVPGMGNVYVLVIQTVLKNRADGDQIYLKHESYETTELAK
jgi:hypothetical protein